MAVAMAVDDGSNGKRRENKNKNEEEEKNWLALILELFLGTKNQLFSTI